MPGETIILDELQFGQSSGFIAARGQAEMLKMKCLKVTKCEMKKKQIEYDIALGYGCQTHGDALV